jgi:hypothetical protein
MIFRWPPRKWGVFNAPAAAPLFPLGSGRQHVGLLQPTLGLKSSNLGLWSCGGCLCARDAAAKDSVAGRRKAMFAPFVIQDVRIWIAIALIASCDSSSSCEI